jgi:predicted RNase H-like HicB family nuclease
MEYTYTCVLGREGDRWLASFPELDASVTYGKTRA